MGTQVKNGRGVGVVVATGDQSEFGVIFADMQDVRLVLSTSGVSTDSRTDRRPKDAATTVDGRASKEALCNLVCCHWRYMLDRCLSEALLARDVHYRRFVIIA